MKILFITMTTLFFGCASSYKAIYPENLNYPTSIATDSITFSYKYDVLWETRNKKYAKQEKKSNLKLVAVRIKNTTGQKINLANDISFHSGTRMLIPEDPKFVKQELKQGVVVYLLYLLLTPVNIYTRTNQSYYNRENTTTNTFPIGLALGPVSSGGNMLVAGSANSKFYKDLLFYNINQEVENGQTAYCLLGFRNIAYEPLTLKLKTK